MNTNIENRSNCPGRIAGGLNGLFHLLCLLFVLGGTTLSLSAGVVHGITVEPGYCPGATVRVEGRGWAAGEVVTIDFQPSGDIFPATADSNGNFSLDTLTLTVDDAGTTFTVTATNDGGDEKSQSFEVSSPPTLDALSDQEACEGDTVVFSVSADGTGPFTYQWFKNGAAITGETSDTLFLDGVTPADDGSSFSVEVSGACGTESTGALLFVNALISTSDIGSQVVCAGNEAVFSTTTSGSGPFSYVWSKDGHEIPGRIDSFLDIPDAQPGDAGTYTVQVIGNCNVATSSATLVVNEAPNLTVLNDQTVCTGGTVVFSTAATGTQPLTFVWFHNSRAIPGAIGSTLVLSNITIADAGTYIVEVNNDCGEVNSSADLTVNETTSIADLASLSKYIGESASFNPTISGTGPHTILWRKDGAEMPGETNSALTIASVMPAHAGEYTVEITGVCNSVTNMVTLTVKPCTVECPANMATTNDLNACGAIVNYPPPITPGPCGPATCTPAAGSFFGLGTTTVQCSLPDGTNCSFTVTVTDAQAPSLACPSNIVAPAAPGLCSAIVTFEVTASDNCDALPLPPGGPAPSINSSVSVVANPPSGSEFPVGTTTVMVTATDLAGNSSACSFTVTILDEQHPTIECPANMAVDPKPGQTTAVVEFSPTATDNCPGVAVSCSPASGSTFPAGTTTVNCTAKDAAGNEAKCSFTVTVNACVSATPLANATRCAGESATFSTVASGTEPFTYQWLFNDAPISTADGSSFTVNAVGADSAGTYCVIVSGRCGSVTNCATLSLGTNITIAPLADQSACPDSTVTFTAQVAGADQISYLWKKDGGTMDGETNSSLRFFNVSAADAGVYSVEVSGACGSATNSAQLTVLEITAIADLMSLTKQPGETAVFSTILSGTGPFTIVWRHDGHVIPGQTGPTLTISPVTLADAGTYTIEVSGACLPPVALNLQDLASAPSTGPATSSATLTVLGDNVIVTPIADLEVCAGANGSFSTTATGSPSFTYAWRKDGVVIPGATGNTLAINHAQSSDTGLYCVEVTWMTGSTTSCARLILNTPTTAKIQDIDAQECHLPSPQEQSEAGLSMTIVEGYPECELRSTLAHVPSGGTVHDGTYLGWCIDYSSLIARDTIYTPTMYLSTGDLPPYLQNANWSYVNYILNHKHGTSIDIQNAIWHFIGGPVPSNDPDYYPASQTALDMIDDASANGGDFMPGPGQIMAVVLDMGGTAQNNIIEVRCPGYVQNCEGEIAVICVTAGGTGPFTYQWYRNGVAIQGENAECLEIDPATSEDSGVYTVTVTGACGSATASAGLVINHSVSLEILAANSIYHRDERACPMEVNLCLGEQGAVYAHASGGGSYLYEWFKDGVSMPCNTCDLHFNNVTANDAGNYTVKVHDACGDETRCFTINVRQPVRLAPLQDIYACQDGYVSIDATVTGDGPYTYIWKHNGVVIPGETNSSVAFIQVSSFDAGQYTVEVIGSCNYIISSMNLVIRTRTEITPLVGKTICEGESAEFNTETAGTGPFQFVWLRNGQVLPGENNNFLAIAAAKPEDSGLYTVSVIGPCNTVTNSATLTVNALAHITRLDDQAACLGEPATFTAAVTGAGPLSYVWKKGNQVIAGQNNNTLTVAQCTAADAGQYTVEVTGPCNMTTLSATLAINVPTDIAALVNKTVCEGDAVTFSTSATGTGPYSFVWKRNGNVLAGQNNSTLTIAHAGTADAGAYSVEVRGLCNTVSSSATLVVNQTTAMAALVNKTSCIGETVVFSAAATGTGPFTYIWRKDGNVLGSQHESTLVINGAAGTDAGQYSVEVQGLCNSATASATLTINALTEITTLSDVTRCLGQSVTFNVMASGTEPFSYLWKKDGIVLPGQTNHLLTIAAVAPADAGIYEIEVTGACGSVKKSASLTINALTEITTLSDATRCLGEGVTFSVTASGTGPFSYLWKKDGNVLPGQTNNALTIAAVAQADAGTYEIQVTGACGSVKKSATLTINTPLQVGLMARQEKCVGDSVTFDATVTGSGPFTFKWIKNGVVAPGETNATCSLHNLTSSDAGYYTVVVSGPCNTVQNNTMLAIDQPVTATPLSAQTKCAGESVQLSTTASGTGPITYVWRRDGIVLAGQTSSSISIAALVPADAGLYCVEVRGMCNSVTNKAAIAVNTPTTATPLADVTKCQGETVVFSTTASGTGPISYIWRKNGAILPGQTASELRINAALPGDAGAYSVEALGACNSVTRSATLTVNAVTEITPLANQTNCVGATITFATTITGASPITIVWRKDDSFLAGETNSTLVLTNVTTANAGAYTVEVTGPCHTASSSATLALAPCSIASIKKSGSTVEVGVKGATGRRYALEGSTDLVHWQQIGTQANQNGLMTFTDANNNGTHMKYYRAVLLP